MKLEILDNVFSKITSKEKNETVEKYFEYSCSFWQKTQYRMVEKKFKKNFLNDKYFLNGFIPKLKELTEVKIKGKLGKLSFSKKNKFGDIVLRKEQEELLDKVLEKQRGVILSPTGSGKTVIITSIIHSVKDFCNFIVVVCHSKDLLYQTKKVLEKNEIYDINIIGDGKKTFGKINIATIQTLSKIDFPNFDVTIIDEVHKCHKISSQYGKFMLNNNSTMRIGFTATLPTTKESLLSLEGLVGPIIGEYTLKEGIEMGRLSTPKITFIKSIITGIDNRMSYAEIYKIGIVNNKQRNRIIIRKVNSKIKQGKSCLVFVKEIEHGNNLLEIAHSQDIFDSKQFVFINGSDTKEKRESIKNLLKSKKVKCVIVTTIWKEGIDIPSLNCILNAASGKSEIAVLQNIGRGLRTTKEKKEVEIIDILDECKYLSNHCIKRLQIYVSKGWL